MTLLSQDAHTAVDTALPAPVVMPGVNLLPPEIAEQARLRRVQLGLAGGLVLTVGVVGLLYAGAAASVADAAAQVEQLTARGAALQAETAELAHVNVVHDQADAAQALLTAAMGEEVRFSQLLDDLSSSVPDRVWLKNVTFTQGGPAQPAPEQAGGAQGIGTVTFTGVGFAHDDVAAWLDSLAKQQGFADPYVSDSTAGRIGDRRTVSFTSTVTLTADALSRRYAAEEGS